jgi:hypothetical protein
MWAPKRHKVAKSGQPAHPRPLSKWGEGLGLHVGPSLFVTSWGRKKPNILLICHYSWVGKVVVLPWKKTISVDQNKKSYPFLRNIEKQITQPLVRKSRVFISFSIEKLTSSSDWQNTLYLLPTIYWNDYKYVKYYSLHNYYRSIKL